MKECLAVDADKDRRLHIIRCKEEIGKILACARLKGILAWFHPDEGWPEINPLGEEPFFVHKLAIKHKALHGVFTLSSDEVGSLPIPGYNTIYQSNREQMKETEEVRDRNGQLSGLHYRDHEITVFNPPKKLGITYP